MQMFILGIIQGIGLVLVVRELNIQWLMHKERKAERLRKAQDEAIALTVPDTCGCHFSWDDHEAYMLEGTTATTSVSSTPDIEWWDVLGVDGKPSGIKVQAREEDYW